MRIDPAGWPFVFLTTVIVVVAWVLAGPWMAAPLLLLPAFMLFFFRDPERTIAAVAGEVLSPADGRVLYTGPGTGRYATGGWQQVSIFLSPMNVHVNRLPIGGRVTRVTFHPGRFLPAYKPEAGELNEYSEVTIDHHGQTVVARQVVGLLARRVVCRVEEGAVVATGDRFGVMKFGSRMDVFLPTTATILVSVDERVVAGVTRLATLAPGTRT
jgi:phosphatidylserine decarboxylase